MFLTLLAMLLATGYASAPECAFDGRGYTEISVTSPNGGRQLDATSCQKDCIRDGCFFWTFYNNSYMCWLLGESATLMDQPDPKATSGAKLCRSGRVKPGEVINIPTKASHLDEALEAIHKSAEEAFKKLDVDRSALVKPQQLVEAPRRQDQAQHSASAQGLVWSILVMIVSGAIVVGGVSAMWILTQDATREVHLTPEQEA
ncbi:unnamed protein product [Durusdinium trenchii]